MTASSIHVISHDLWATTSFVRDMEHTILFLKRQGNVGDEALYIVILK